MIRTVLAKELGEHFWFLFGLAAVTGIAYLLVFAGQSVEGGGSFSALSVTSQTFAFIVAAVLCGRLLTRENASNTRIFLGALPLSWSLVVFTKMALGYISFVGFALLPLLAAWVYETRSSNLPDGLIAVVFVHVASFASFQFLLFAFITQLGRYRYVFYIVIFVSFWILNSAGWLYMDDVAPLRLVDERLSSEIEFDTRALSITWAFALGFLGMSLLVQCWNRGALAASMAQRMSHREKVFVAVIVLGLVYAASLVQEKTLVDDFFLPGARLFEDRGVLIEIAAGKTAPSGVESLGYYLSDEIADFMEFLGWEGTPTLFIGLTGSLDGDEFEFQTYPEVDGIFAQVNNTDERWRREAFLSEALKQLALQRSKGALAREDRLWVLEGFAELWPQREAVARNEPSARLVLRTLYGSRDLDPRALQQWLQVKARHGNSVASAVAASFLVALGQYGGGDSGDEFVRAILGPRVPGDVRALFVMPDVVATLTETTGAKGWPEIYDFWRNTLLSTWLVAHEAELNALPVLEAEVQLTPVSDAHVAVSCRWSRGAIGQGFECTFLHAPCGPHRRLVFPHEPRAQGLGPSNQWESIEAPFSPGDRHQWTVEAFLPQLGCDVISGWQLLEVPR